MLYGPSPGSNFRGRDVHRWHFTEIEELGQLLGINSIVLLIRPEDQPQVARVRHLDLMSQPR